MNLAPIGITAALASLLLVGCTTTPDPTPGENAAASEAFAHIHGLSALTTADQVTVATHSGVFEITSTDGDTSIVGPVGDLDIDAMGFTKTDDVIYASGHPGPKTPTTFGSPNLGVVISEDDGKTWNTLSLTGEADFHTLTIHPGETTTLYGLKSSSPNLQISTDGGYSWTEGAPLEARDVLADGSSSSTVYATTAKGLMRSDNAGKTFAVDPGAPALFLITSNASMGLLAGIDTSGNVWSKQGNDDWMQGGTITGAPQAMTIARESSTLIVADDRGISASDDFGRTWETVWAAR